MSIADRVAAPAERHGRTLLRQRSPAGRIRAPFLHLLVIASITVAPAAQASLTAQQVDAVIQPAMLEWAQVGLAVAVVDGDGPALIRSYGVRDVRTRSAVTPDTIFGIGSCSKAFAAADVARLVDQRRLQWDARVNQHLPWFQTNDPWVTRELTVRDILTHRSGLQAGMPREAAIDRRSYLETLRTTELQHSFRNQFSYSNDAYTLAGELVETVSGTRWEEFTRQNFWQPLRMNRTNADHRVARRDRNSATPHVTVDGRAVPVPWVYEDFTALPSGGVNSSAADMANWVRFQLSNGTSGDRVLLSPEAMAEMHAPQTPVRAGTGDTSGVFSTVVGRGPGGNRFENYGMGWYTHDYRGHTMVYHGGTITGFRCVVGMLPDQDFGVAVLINQDNTMLPQAIFQRLVDLRLGIQSQDWPAVFRQRFQQVQARQRASIAAIDSARIQNTQPSQPLADFAGRFAKVDGDGSLEVEVANGAMTITLGRAEYEAVHWHHDVFRLIPRRLRLEDGVIAWPYPTEHDFRAFVGFDLDERGSISGLNTAFGRYRKAGGGAR